MRPWTKMAQPHLWILLLCLQTWLVAAGRDADSFLNGILGESVTFPLNIQKSQQVKSIAWTSESSVAVITPGKTPNIIVTHNNYNGRITVIQENYNLIISDLRMEDAGKYKADITITTAAAATTTTKNYDLHVYRRLGRPKITQSLMTSMNGTCNVTLTCSVEKEEKNVSYSWGSLETEGNVLQIIQTPGNQGLNYTCTAWNPVSNNSSSISSQQLCADAASENIIYTYARVSKDTQPAEAKIYDEISQSKVSPSKNESLKTIYSTVQYSDGMKKTNTLGSKPPKASGYEMVI
ncbi:SLAM family member 5 isoform X2 [Heterocephalus glaber]|uniref:SLAM family member 5 isoform X2 n=1 Tax=Heterocephalus glaber TaxID=10181 RepID=A0AAX6PU30_HETGA|nr:SLAM family member 5 isoform X2 [Heterocephalus glaber]